MYLYPMILYTFVRHKEIQEKHKNFERLKASTNGWETQRSEEITCKIVLHWTGKTV